MAAPILIVTGCSAVGKSTVSRHLARSVGDSAHFPIDALLFFFDDPFPEPDTQEGARRYRVVGAAVAAAAAQLAEGGYTVILDGPMLPDGADSMAERLERRGIEVHYVVLRTDFDVCLERSLRRDAATTDASVLRGYYARFVDLGESEANVIDASGSAEQVAASVLSAFRSGRLARGRTAPHQPNAARVADGGL